MAKLLEIIDENGTVWVNPEFITAVRKEVSETDDRVRAFVSLSGCLLYVRSFTPVAEIVEKIRQMEEDA